MSSYEDELEMDLDQLKPGKYVSLLIVTVTCNNYYIEHNAGNPGLCMGHFLPYTFKFIIHPAVCVMFIIITSIWCLIQTCIRILSTLSELLAV
jgi:hypothetical protein